MSELQMTTEDVLASTMVLEDVMNASDSMTPEQAVEYRIACEKVQAAAKLAVDMLNMSLVAKLDGQPAIIRDGYRYYIGRKSEKRIFDHGRIALRIADAVLERNRDPDTGEFTATYREVAHQTAEAMRNVYCSDSTSAKVTQLDRYGINRDENQKGSVLEVQRGQKEVKRVPAGGET